MNIYYQKRGGHMHMRVFVNGAKAGDLCVRESEWKQFQASFSGNVAFLNDDENLASDNWER